ncbi:MAG: hypothetical protein M1815_001740 [Lichina confinis]|nr:MAG: hypothetical protein M1815_001740 [Lichina confinis]
MPPGKEQPEKSQSSNSGIVTLDTGERHIPASRRADGSKRPEIKVRPGYKPPEDVQAYKNRTAEAWRTRGGGGVPGATTVGKGESETTRSKASNKNAKRKEARRKAKAVAGASKEEELSAGVDRQDAVAGKADEALEHGAQRHESSHSQSRLDGAEAETDKLAKKLQKKLRQAKDLKEKQDYGAKLQPEQLEKIAGIEDLIQQLDGLGFGLDGPRSG